MPFKKFEVKDFLRKNLQKFGFEELFPIQEEALPAAIEGKDILGQAKTGTGKTLAFSIPLVNQVVPGRRVQALVLAPTRELARQVHKEIKKLVRGSGIKTLCVYGGVSIKKQIHRLNKGVQIVVGTPGRILDHLRRKTLKLDKLKVFVLDEADRMLDMGFIDDVEKIISRTPKKKQVMMFSATIPEAIHRLSSKYMNKPVKVSVSGDVLTVENTNQYYVDAHLRRDKFDLLCNLIEQRHIKQAIIFCRTKSWSDHLARQMKKLGFDATAIHGDLSQHRRNKVMKKFKRGGIKYLVATDVAARGLDIPNVSHVINYDAPRTAKSYVHRIGRTGRAGSKGVAITLLTKKDYLPFRKRIHDRLGVEINEMSVEKKKKYSKTSRSGRVIARRGKKRSRRSKKKKSKKHHKKKGKKRDKSKRKTSRKGKH